MSRPCEICSRPETSLAYSRHLCLQCAAYQARIEQLRRDKHPPLRGRDVLASAILWALFAAGILALVVGIAKAGG